MNNIFICHCNCLDHHSLSMCSSSHQSPEDPSKLCLRSPLTLATFYRLFLFLPPHICFSLPVVFMDWRRSPELSFPGEKTSKHFKLLYSISTFYVLISYNCNFLPVIMTWKYSAFQPVYCRPPLKLSWVNYHYPSQCILLGTQIS